MISAFSRLRRRRFAPRIFFLELTAHDGEFVVHHEKLIEYGIVTSNRSFHVKDRLDALELVEDIDYLPNDVRAGPEWNQTYQSLQARSAVAEGDYSHQKHSKLSPNNGDGAPRLPYESSETTCTES